MLRHILRVIFLLITAASLVAAGVNGYRILQDPMLAQLIDRSLPDIDASITRMVNRAATPEKLDQLITARLAQDPRDWVVLEALKDLSQAQDHPLPAAYQAAWEEDSAFMAQASDCLACIWDIAQCSTAQVLICKGPVMLTPIEDARGILKAGIDYVSGDQVDQLDLGLSVVGLGATATLIATGGGSGVVKAGSALIKTARGMGRLSPKLLRLTQDSVSLGVRSPEALRPLGEILGDLGRTQGKLGTAGTLHMLPLIDDAQDARRLAKAAEAVGPRSISALEVVGKSKFLRATLRVSDEVIGLVAGLVGLIGALAMTAFSIGQAIVTRRVKAAVLSARQ